LGQRFGRDRGVVADGPGNVGRDHDHNGSGGIRGPGALVLLVLRELGWADIEDGYISVVQVFINMLQ
jgi:hypothetical protein